MLKLDQINAETYYAAGSTFFVDDEAVEFLKEKALASPRKRARICFHSNVSDATHEMLIVVSSESYIRPHRHLGKHESLLALEGEATALFFQDDGTVTDAKPLGPVGRGRTSYYRISDPIWHTLSLESPFFVYKEVTQGPFDPSDSEFASWAPSEEDPQKAKQYQQSLARLITK